MTNYRDRAQSIKYIANYAMNFYERRIIRNKCSDKELGKWDN